MFLEKIKTDGIAHISYVLGSGDQAAVIDPRRDINVYLKIARERGVNITHIFETHRNEDYVIGSLALAEQTGAAIYHGIALDFSYGNPVSQGDQFKIGQLQLEVHETPGHTFESISIAIFDSKFGDKAVGVFTGDALFIGDVGRTDFFPDQSEKVAGLLYDSIFNKILPLGDQAILYPAHGAGSVCGSGMASREFSTLGYERMFNPVLQKNKKEFIDYKTHEKHVKPPYFKMMEQYNQYGPPMEGIKESIAVLSADQFEKKIDNGVQVIDTRSPESLAGIYLGRTLAIPMNMIPAFAGWFLSYNQPIGLIVESPTALNTALCHLYRLGYDDIIGYLSGGIHTWEVQGKPYDNIGVIHAYKLQQMLDRDESFTLLDVRSSEEYQQQHLPDSINIYLGHLPSRLQEVPKDKPIVTFCGSGRRAIIAASILKMNGFESVSDCLGSMSACSQIGCDIIK